MLYLDIKKACNNKGIDDARHWMTRNGFSHVVTTRLLNNKQESINFVILENLCIKLNCTPNELFSWQPDVVGVVATTSAALQKLKPIAAKDSVGGKLKALSPDKLEDLQTFLDELSK